MVTAGAPVDHVAIHPYAVHDQSPTIHVPYDRNFDDIGRFRDFLEGRGLQNVTSRSPWGCDSTTVGTQTRRVSYYRRFTCCKPFPPT